MPGSFILAPGFDLTFNGNSNTTNGCMAANSFSFGGCPGGTIDGSIIDYGGTPTISFGGTHLTFEPATSGGHPAGFVFVPGDINGDGLVDVADYDVWAANVGATGATWSQGDLNGDGLVDVADYDIWAADVGNTAAAPEPATLSLLALGGLAVLRRRK
jgi:hypothetical protein